MTEKKLEISQDIKKISSKILRIENTDRIYFRGIIKFRDVKDSISGETYNDEIMIESVFISGDELSKRIPINDDYFQSIKLESLDKKYKDYESLKKHHLLIYSLIKDMCFAGNVFSKPKIIKIIPTKKQDTMEYFVLTRIGLFYKTRISKALENLVKDGKMIYCYKYKNWVVRFHTLHMSSTPIKDSIKIPLDFDCKDVELSEKKAIIVNKSLERIPLSYLNDFEVQRSPWGARRSPRVFQISPWGGRRTRLYRLQTHFLVIWIEKTIPPRQFIGGNKIKDVSIKGVSIKDDSSIGELVFTKKVDETSCKFNNSIETGQLSFNEAYKTWRNEQIKIACDRDVKVSNVVLDMIGDISTVRDDLRGVLYKIYCLVQEFSNYNFVDPQIEEGIDFLKSLKSYIYKGFDDLQTHPITKTLFDPSHYNEQNVMGLLYKLLKSNLITDGSLIGTIVSEILKNKESLSNLNMNELQVLAVWAPGEGIEGIIHEKMTKILELKLRNAYIEELVAISKYKKALLFKSVAPYLEIKKELEEHIKEEEDHLIQLNNVMDVLKMEKVDKSKIGNISNIVELKANYKDPTSIRSVVAETLHDEERAVDLYTDILHWTRDNNKVNAIVLSILKTEKKHVEDMKKFLDLNPSPPSAPVVV